MPEPATPSQPAARPRKRASTASRSRHGPAPLSVDADDMIAHRGWMAAMQVREAMQGRIVRAFRLHLEGLGPGPTDVELLMFARLAVAEQRLHAASHKPSAEVLP